MSLTARKRILVDIKNIKKNEDLEKCGIFVHFNEENIYNAKALIMGPSDTPYEKGYYFFDINFPSDYPMEPPKVKMMTLKSGVRFNPNLYTCGKVCLSIINTWHGPGWTSCLTLNSVLLSIQSLMNEIPIRNEPGFEGEMKDGDISKRYNRIIEYHNILVAVVKMFEEMPYGFESFTPVMEDLFIKNHKFYYDYLDSISKYDGKTFTTKIYSLCQKFEVYNLKSKLDKILNSLNINKSLETNVVNSEEKSKKKKPTAKASDFEEGYRMLSDNDNSLYEVKVVTTNKGLTYKRWVPFKIDPSLELYPDPSLHI
jgi:ubiquitin-protein ligase